MYHWNFTVTAANATAGAAYTNNGQTFTVIDTAIGATTLITHGTGTPSSTGHLTLISGVGDATIIFSAAVLEVLPNNTLRFQAPLIDFATEVGLSGQDHEKFPAPDAQPRWDWLLIWFISLLANQSSYEEPTQYRDGTIWFDLNTLVLKIWRSSLENISGSWLSVATSIELESIASTPVTLSAWYTSTNSKLSGAAPVTTFGGYVTSISATEIPVPVTLQGEIDLVKTRPFVYVTSTRRVLAPGTDTTATSLDITSTQLIDPRSCEYYTATTIKLLNGVTLVAGDRFTVVIQNILPANFSIPDVVI